MWLSWCSGTSALAGWWTHVQDRSHESTRLDCSYSVCEQVVASSVAHTYRPKTYQNGGFKLQVISCLTRFITCSNWVAVVDIWEEKPGLKNGKKTFIFLYSEEMMWVLIFSMVRSSESSRGIKRLELLVESRGFWSQIWLIRTLKRHIWKENLLTSLITNIYIYTDLTWCTRWFVTQNHLWISQRTEHLAISI